MPAGLGRSTGAADMGRFSPDGIAYIFCDIDGQIPGVVAGTTFIILDTYYNRRYSRVSAGIVECLPV